jgi:hypothetical protein
MAVSESMKGPHIFGLGSSDPVRASADDQPPWYKKILATASYERYTSTFYSEQHSTLGEELALCPNCKMDVRGETVIRELIDVGRRARSEPLAITSMDVYTTMYSCPNCHVILGIATYTSY